MQQFKSMDDLVEYLGNLENRIKTLEAENANLRAVPPKPATLDGSAIARYVASLIPRSNLFSPDFLKRAFAVWGHFFVANLIIGTIISIAYFCFVIVLFGSTFGNLIQLNK